MHLTPDVPHEFARQYDQERAARLRIRAIWYCILILALVAFSLVVNTIDLFVPGTFDDDPSAATEMFTDALYSILFVGALVYFACRPRSRPEIVRAFQWVVAVSGIVGVAVTPLVTNASWIPGATLDHNPDTDRAQAYAILGTVFLLHALASIFVALSAREGLMPLLPIFGAYAAWVLLVSVGSIQQRLTLIAIFPLAGLPGFVWSLWRYRSFNERFHARAVGRRYAEVTRELAEARRVHEALFPPPISRGPIRLKYRYEPARHIGGDFLFVHPLTPAPADGISPLTVVIIDVTGHGVAAALAVSRLNGELERICAHDPAPRPADVLRALNRFTSQNFAAQGIYATALCLRIDADARTVQWASAGHPPAFLRAGDSIDLLGSTATMLGVLDDALFDAAQCERRLDPDDIIIAYTDGLIEAQGSDGSQFGLDAGKRLVETAPRDGSLADLIAGAVEAHRPGPPADDTLVVEIRTHAGALSPQPVS
jgi:serine phosphatase RsbU (regulator of sigma subunit)